MQFITQLTAEATPTVHIAPQTLTTVHGFPITNSMVFGWVTGILLLVLFMSVARRITIQPRRGFTQIVEIGTDFVAGLLESSLGSRKKALKYAPYFTAIFFFIALSNVIGLLPG